MTWAVPLLVVAASVAVVQEVGVMAGAFLAVTGALGWIVKKIHQLGIWLHEVNTIVSRELTPNNGSSIKDRVTENTAQVRAIRRQLDAHLEDVLIHAANPTAHHRDDWPDDGPAGPR